MPDKFSHVNIPTKNGILCLRPKKVRDIKPDLVENIDPETITHIKTLQETLTALLQKANVNSK